MKKSAQYAVLIMALTLVLLITCDLFHITNMFVKFVIGFGLGWYTDRIHTWLFETKDDTGKDENSKN